MGKFDFGSLSPSLHTQQPRCYQPLQPSGEKFSEDIWKLNKRYMNKKSSLGSRLRFSELQPPKERCIKSTPPTSPPTNGTF
jgi:hypothetical protein